MAAAAFLIRDGQMRGERITILERLKLPGGALDGIAKPKKGLRDPRRPYVTAFFMPRKAGDRPDVVPEGAVNFAFIGQFAETTRDCIFTTEYSVRTGMEAVYRLLGVERGVPEVFGSTYDIRVLLEATTRLRDGEPARPGQAPQMAGAQARHQRDRRASQGRGPRQRGMSHLSSPHLSSDPPAPAGARPGASCAGRAPAAWP